jgi:hypothetical protein
MTDEYVAGFFDGEGCVSSFTAKMVKSPKIRIILSQKDPAILYQIQNHLNGIGKVRVNGAISRFEIHRRDDILEFISHVKSHTVIKRRQLELAEQMLRLYNVRNNVARNERVRLHTSIMADKRMFL